MQARDNNKSNSGSLMPFSSMVQKGDQDDFETESIDARPVQETQSPDPDALLRPHYHHYPRSGDWDLQQITNSQVSLSIDAVSSGGLARIETGLRSLPEHTALDQLTTCTCSSITTPQQETPLGASGPYTMAGVRMFFYEAKRCLERDFSTSTAQSLGQSLEARQSSHKGIQSSWKKQTHAFLGIQQCPAYFTLDDDSAMTKVTTSRGVGVVWSIWLSQRMSSNNSQQIPTETTTTVYSGRLLACPNCSCLMQLGAQIKIQNSSSGVAVDLRIKRLDIVRSNRLFRHVSDSCCSCGIKNYYITVQVHFGESVSRQTFWKFTI